MTTAATQRVLTVMQGVPDEYENELVSMVVDFKLKIKEPEKTDKSSHDADNGYTVPSVEKRQKALARLMKHKGSVHLPEDRDAAKEEYLRSKYESFN